MPSLSPAPQDSHGNSRAREMREAARNIFDHAMAECNIAKAFARSLRSDGDSLFTGDDGYRLSEFAGLSVVSMGKAGHAMAEALSNIIPIGEYGIVACPTLPPSPIPGFHYFVGGHPLPNEESLRAGSAILKHLRALPERSLVLFLIS